MLAGLCLFVNAQNIPLPGAPKEKLFAVGDTLPNIRFYSISGSADSFALSEISARLIILDIWGAYCIPCLRNFPKMNNLQGLFKNDLKILLLTGNPVPPMVQAADRTLKKFEKETAMNFQLSAVYTDTLTTNRLIYNTAVPHYVWLNNKGRIIATTDAATISADNIRRLLAGEELLLPVLPAHTGKLMPDAIITKVAL